MQYDPLHYTVFVHSPKCRQCQHPIANGFLCDACEKLLDRIEERDKQIVALVEEIAVLKNALRNFVVRIDAYLTSGDDESLDPFFAVMDAIKAARDLLK